MTYFTRVGSWAKQKKNFLFAKGLVNGLVVDYVRVSHFIKQDRKSQKTGKG